MTLFSVKSTPYFCIVLSCHKFLDLLNTVSPPAGVQLSNLTPVAGSSIKVKETDEIREGIKNLQNLLRGVEKERVAYLNLKSQIKILKGSISQNKKDILEIEKSKPLTRDIDELKKQVNNNLTILDNITSKIKSTTKK